VNDDNIQANPIEDTNDRNDNDEAGEPTLGNDITKSTSTVDNDESNDESRESGDRNQLQSVQSKCSWSISSKGCLLEGVEPKDVCGVEGCQNVFHHACQTEWEFFQYRLDCPNGDPNNCTYNSGGNK